MPEQGTEQRKLAAIMFTDMVGYTALSQRNETLALELLEEHRHLLRDLFPRFAGQEIKTMGDGFLVEFASALEAAKCAIEIQRTLAQRNLSAPSERQVKVRIGIHIGDMVHRGGDVLGDGVNIASRIEPLAEPGGICISVDVAHQIQHNLEVKVATLGPAALKNVQVPMELFRIVLPWEKEPKALPAVPPGSATQTRVRALSAALLVAAAMLIVGGWWVYRTASANGGKATTNSTQLPALGRATTLGSLAVKPLDDYSGDTNQAYLSDGMTEALCASLGNVSSLRVPGRSSVMRYKGSAKSIPEIARELGVDAIVEGSIQRAGNRILITVQLIDGITDRHFWATNYQRDLSDFFIVQNEVSQAIAAEIKIRLTPEDRDRLARAESAKPETIEAYLKGRQSWNKRNADDLRKGIEYFERAIQFDPNYAPAYVGLADCTAAQVGYAGVRPSVAFPQAEAYVNKAIALNERLAEAHATLSMLKYHYDLDWPGAEKECLRAIELNPSYAPAHYWYALLLVALGREAEGESEYKRALQLDPLSAVAHWHAGFINYHLRRYDQAAAEFKRVLEIDPTYGVAKGYLSGVERQIKVETEAVAIIERRPADQPIRKAAALIEAYRILGLADFGRSRLKQMLDQTKADYVDRLDIAEAFCMIGDRAQALVYLNRAYEERSNNLFLLRTDPAWDSVRGEPGFQELLKKMKLDK
jgi:adenylate cyclase